MKNDIMQTTVRGERDLIAALKHKAIDNRRSLNEEILYRLQESLRREENASNQQA